MKPVDLNVPRMHSKHAQLQVSTPVVVLAVGPFPLRMSVCLNRKSLIACMSSATGSVSPATQCPGFHRYF